MTWKDNDFEWGFEKQQDFKQIKWQRVCAVALGPVQKWQDVKKYALYLSQG